MGGLTLRDTGFDEDVCKMGDELIKASLPTLSEEDWHSLTIPAHRESPAASPARIIRLGFPEWTIWALPLAAHEFGHVMAKQSKRLEALIMAGKPRKRGTSYREEYAADAIATYTMGPAYACAAILLRFDPTSAYADQATQPADARRTHAVFTMLEWMNEKDGMASYRSVIDQLRKQWKVALDQAQPKVKPEQKEFLERLWEYLEEDEDPVEKVEKVDPELNEFLKGLWEYLEEDEDPITGQTPIMYSAQSWAGIEDWSKRLNSSGEGGPETEINLDAPN